MLPSLLALSLLLLQGCAQTASCPDPEAALATSGDATLQCAEALRVPRYIRLLAGRSTSQREQELILGEVKSRFEADPAATQAWLSQLTTAVKELEILNGSAGAERRARLVYDVAKGEGLIPEGDPVLWNILSLRLSVWSRDDDEKLALTEMDIEGWIHYASLCREVQGGGTLRVSVSDRHGLYNTLRDRWDHGSREEQIALAAIGPYWSQVKRSWQASSYERQQQWIAAAPLPPPMTATSLGYAEAVFRGDLVRHADVLHEKLGPFYQGVD